MKKMVSMNMSIIKEKMCLAPITGFHFTDGDS